MTRKAKNKRRSTTRTNALVLLDSDKGLKRAFEAMRLDPQKSADWKTLATTLAQRYFSETPKRGRPVAWSEDRLKQLFDDSCDVLERHDVTISNSAICEALRKSSRFKNRWRSFGTPYLRRQLLKAQHLCL